MPAVEEYLDRIGIAGPISAGADGLRSLQRAHLFSVPFENLDIHLGVPIVLDEAAFLDKLVRRRRGGFCYELNGAFAWLLRELDFDVRMLSANVHGENGWGIDFDHMLLSVQLGERWLVDVGFGDNFVEPLRWQEGIVQEQPVGAFRLERSRRFWVLKRTDGGGNFTPQYRFEDRSYELADFQPGCDYNQSPASHFSRGTVCSLARPDGRITLRSDRLIETNDGGRLETPIATKAIWEQLLQQRFGIVLGEPSEAAEPIA